MPNEPISLKSSNKDIFASGTVHTFSLDNLEIQLSNLKFIISFINDGGGSRWEINPVSNIEMTLRLFNIKNTLGTSLSEPIKVGTYQNRELYFMFTVYAITNSSVKLFHYTFFWGAMSMPLENQAKDNGTKIDLPGKISQLIGTGKHARAAIVWETIKWSFFSGVILTALLLLASWIKIISITIEDIIKIWSIFIPIITLALGYFFGKDVE